MEGTRTLDHGPCGYGVRSLTRARKIQELEIPRGSCYTGHVVLFIQDSHSVEFGSPRTAFSPEL